MWEETPSESTANFVRGFSGGGIPLSLFCFVLFLLDKKTVWCMLFVLIFEEFGEYATYHKKCPCL